MTRLFFVLAPAILAGLAVFAFALLLGNTNRAAAVPAFLLFFFVVVVGWSATTPRPARGEGPQK